MIKFRDLIQEDSFGASDVPKYFWLAAQFDDHVQEFIDMQLNGVSGISGSRLIVRTYFGVRNALLTMESSKVLSINKLTRVMYDNPYYLANDNMRAFRRLVAPNVNPEKGIPKLTLATEFFNALKKLYPESKDFLQQASRMQLFPWVIEDLIPNIPIKDFNHLCAVFNKAIQDFLSSQKMNGGYWYEEDVRNLLTHQDTKKTLALALQIAVKSYKGEAEWMLKDSKLNIPIGSSLVLLRDKELIDKFKDGASSMSISYERETIEKYKAQDDIIKRNGMDKKLRIHIVDSATYQKTRENLDWSDESKYDD